jgi:hypothetical protein
MIVVIVSCLVEWKLALMLLSYQVNVMVAGLSNEVLTNVVLLNAP